MRVVKVELWELGACAKTFLETVVFISSQASLLL